MAAQLSFYLKEMITILTVVGLPKTIDNDVYPIKQTLGAFTAAEQGAVFFENISNETRQVLVNSSIQGNYGRMWMAYCIHSKRISR